MLVYAVSMPTPATTQVETHLCHDCCRVVEQIRRKIFRKDTILFSNLIVHVVTCQTDRRGFGKRTLANNPKTLAPRDDHGGKLAGCPFACDPRLLRSVKSPAVSLVSDFRDGKCRYPFIDLDGGRVLYAPIGSDSRVDTPHLHLIPPTDRDLSHACRGGWSANFVRICICVPSGL
jgi:hypothetical protein